MAWIIEENKLDAQQRNFLDKCGHKPQECLD